MPQLFSLTVSLQSLLTVKSVGSGRVAVRLGNDWICDLQLDTDLEADAQAILDKVAAHLPEGVGLAAGPDFIRELAGQLTVLDAEDAEPDYNAKGPSGKFFTPDELSAKGIAASAIHKAKTSDQ